MDRLNGKDLLSQCPSAPCELQKVPGLYLAKPHALVSPCLTTTTTDAATVTGTEQTLHFEVIG